MARDTRFNPARKDQKGRPIAVPTNDLNPARLALPRYSWEREDEQKEAAR